VRVDGGERRLEPGHTERRRLERHLLLVPCVWSVVGRDRGDRSVLQSLDEPRIAVGRPANLVLLDLNASYRITEESFRSRSANSWLLGRTVKGKVRATIAAGKLVHGA